MRILIFSAVHAILRPSLDRHKIALLLNVDHVQCVFVLRQSLFLDTILSVQQHQLLLRRQHVPLAKKAVELAYVEVSEVASKIQLNFADFYSYSAMSVSGSQSDSSSRRGEMLHI